MEGNSLEVRVDDAIYPEDLGEIIMTVKAEVGRQVELGVACSLGSTKFLVPRGDRLLRETVIKVLEERGHRVAAQKDQIGRVEDDCLPLDL